jgi:TonB family protein
MDMNHFQKTPGWFKRASVKLFRAVALALVVTMVLPALASDSRAIKSRVAPIYPDLARRMRIEGVVNVEATVDADGTVKSAKTISGNAILAPAAEDAVIKWKFESSSAASKVKIDITFVLPH